jgi:hypothetical protein
VGALIVASDADDEDDASELDDSFDVSVGAGSPASGEITGISF